MIQCAFDVNAHTVPVEQRRTRTLLARAEFRCCSYWWQLVRNVWWLVVVVVVGGGGSSNSHSGQNTCQHNNSNKCNFNLSNDYNDDENNFIDRRNHVFKTFGRRVCQLPRKYFARKRRQCSDCRRAASRICIDVNNEKYLKKSTS